jgi:hypothetical protein
MVMKHDWENLIQQYLTEASSDEDTLRLQQKLKEDAALRRLYLDHVHLDVALEAFADASGSAPLTSSLAASPRGRWPTLIQRQPLAAAVAGLMMGLFSAAVVWAIAGPVAYTRSLRISELANGGFESSRREIGTGFPTRVGVWCGNETEVVASTMPQAIEGNQALRLLRAGRDETQHPDVHDNDRSPRSCDLYQLVDLTRIRHQALPGEEAVLELSMNVLDTRAKQGEPIRFGCHVMLFEGDPLQMHALWPLANREALASGSKRWDSRGGAGQSGSWTKLTARCVLPPNADYAVIWLAAATLQPRPSQQGPMVFGEQYIDDVSLLLKIQPPLPIRVMRP